MTMSREVQERGYKRDMRHRDEVWFNDGVPRYVFSEKGGFGE